MQECECKGIELFKDLHKIIVNKLNSNQIETDDLCVTLKNLVVCLFANLDCNHDEQINNMYDFFKDCGRHLIDCHVRQMGNKNGH